MQKNKHNFIMSALFSSLVLIGLVFNPKSASADSMTCKSFLSKNQFVNKFTATTDQNADWRKGFTNLDLPLDNDLGKAPTSIARENFIQATTKAMFDFLVNEQDTPEMVFAAAEGVSVKVQKEALQTPPRTTIPLNYAKDSASQGYHFDEIPQIEVSGLGASGVLKGTLLLPVSGHTNFEDSTKWRDTDTYEIYLKESKHGSYRNAPTLVRNKLAKDYITAQEISMTLKPGEVYELTYDRSGSMGPSGYPEGRILRIVWDGK